MSQFLLVQGADAVAAMGLFEGAISTFQRLCGLSPCDSSLGEGLLVAKFPRLRVPSGPIACDVQSGAWVCDAGTWTLRGERDCGRLATTIGRASLETSTDVLCRESRELDGMFALVCGGRSREEATIITDRLGRLHVYLAKSGGCLLASTSSLVLAAITHPEWDVVGCREFLATGTVFEQRTLFKGIEKLAPATIYQLRRGELRKRVLYWDLASVMYDGAPRQTGIADVAEALADSFQTISRVYPKPVLDLTGGFDSRVLLGVALKSGCEFHTVVNGNADDPDVLVANRIARQFGLAHRHQRATADWPGVWWRRAKEALLLCDGEYNILEYARTLEHHSRLAGAFDVSVNGSGGEICKGYWWELLFPFIGRKGHFKERKLAAGRFAGDPAADSLLGDASQSLDAHFAGVIARANRGFEHLPNTAKTDNVYLTLRMQRWQGRIASATDRIWPCISPFLLRAPMEAALAAPPAVRVRHRLSRRLIEHLNPDLAVLPLASGEPAMPLRWNNVHRFWPMGVNLCRKMRRGIWGERKPGSIPSQNPLRTLLEGESEVRNLIHVPEMKTAALYKPLLIKRFLESAQKPSFHHAGLLGRIVSLELLVRHITK